MFIQEQHTEQRPYRGMQTFSEEHKNLFFGRTKPVDEIFDLLKNNLLTVIFGKSGIGKSSLLNAGLLPKLRENFYLPILIRIPFSDTGVDPLAYTQSAIETAVKKYIYRDFKYPANATLWQFFREANYTGGAVIPVLIFDQFEEYFNFGKQNKQSAEAFIKELSDLIENRMLGELHSTDAYKTLSASDTQNNFRVVISLREDFLAPLEDLSKLIPSLNKMRYRILQLRGKEAFDAVYLPAKHLIDEETTVYLLRKIIPKKIKVEVERTGVDVNETDWEQKDFEPYIISLFCYQVNEKRIAANQNKISKELIDQTKVESILNDYYSITIKKYRRKYRRNINEVLEKNLVSEEGYRLLKPVNSNEFKDVPEQAIKELVDDRIIQIVNRNDINNIEISHDLLAKVIHQKKTEQSKNRRFYYLAGAFGLLLAVIIFWFYNSQEKIRSELVAAANTVARDSVIKDSLKTGNDSIAQRFEKTIQEINASYLGTVYFQVNWANLKQPKLVACMQELRDSRFVVPSAELIKNKPFKSIVKYFHDGDSAIAKNIAAVCKKYYSFEVPPRKINLKNNQVPLRTVEVWLFKDSVTNSLK